MAQTIKLKRSATQNAVPSTSALALGEIAINTYDGKIFIKKDDGSESIVTIGELSDNGVTSAKIAANAVGSSEIAGNAVTSTQIAKNAVGSSELASTGVTSGSYGSSSAIPVVTVDADGRVTSLTTASISGLSANSVTATEIAANAVGSSEIAANSVGIDELNVSDGTNGQALITDGSGNLSFGTVASSSASSAVALTTDTATSTGSASFTLSISPTSENNIIAFADGVFQNQDSYSISGNTLTFDTAPDSGTKMVFYSVGAVYSGQNVIVDNFSGDNSTVAFTLSDDPQDENNTQVYIDGVYQQKTEYSVSGTTLTFSSAPPTGTDNIEVIIFSAASIQTISNNAAVSTSIASNAVLSRHIAANAITASEIASGTVIAADIADNTITAVKLASDSVTGVKIADNAIGASHIAKNAVDSSEIVSGSIDTVHLSATSVTEAKIAANAVTSAKIAANSVGISELDLSDGSVGQVLTTDGSGTITFEDVLVKSEAVNQTGSAIAKGVPVYQVGSSGNAISVAPADADDSNKMPAIGVTLEALSANGGTGEVAHIGFIKGINTSSYTAGDTLYISTSGGFTTTKPTGETGLIQNMARVIKVDSSNGSIVVMGAGRSNAVSNLDDGDIFIGNASNQAVTATLDTSIVPENTNLYYTDARVDSHLSGGSGITYSSGTISIAGNAITSTMIAANAVGSSEIAASGVTAGSYGSATAIPTLTIDADGRVTSASTASISSSLTIDADSGTPDTVTIGTDTLTFSGTTNEIETSVSNNEITIGLPNDVVITGNLTVNGTTVTNSATNTTIEDLLIELGTGTTGTPANDAGIVIERGDSDNAFIGWDESADKFTLGTGSFTGASTGNLTISTGTLVANIEGDVTGDLTGTASAVADNAVTAAKIAANSVGISELNVSDGTSGQFLSTNGSGTLSFASATSTIAGATDTSITSPTGGQFLIYDGTNSWDNISLSGDATVAANGTVTISANAISATEISANSVGIDELNVSDGTNGQALITNGSGTLSFADVAGSLADASDSNISSPTSGQILVYDGTDSFDNVSISGDATLSNTGALTIASNAVESSMIAGNAVGASQIAANSVGVSELNVSDGTNGQFLQTNGSGTLSFATVNPEGSVVYNYTDTGDGTTVTFDTGVNPQNENNTWVFVGGVYQPKSSYSYSSTSITFSEAPPNGEDIEIITGKVAGFDSADTVLGIYSATTTATDTYDTGLSAANENNTFVFIEGVYQPKNTYSFSGTTITFDANTPTGLALEVMATKTLSASAVTTGTIAANAVTTAKIASNNVTTASIASNAITSALIAGNAITASEIATNAITGNELDSGALAGKNMTGNIAFDTNTLYIDSTDNQVGIGTASPDYKLEVAGDASFLGQDVLIDSQSGYKELRHTQTGENFAISSPESLYFIMDSNNDQTSRSIVFAHNNTTPASATELMRIGEDGNVGIGTNNPGGKLHVDNGTNTGNFDAFRFTAGSLGNGNDVFGYFGKSTSNYEGLKLHYYYNTNTSTTRAILGVTGVSNQLVLNGDGDVGIGTGIPGGRLDVRKDTTGELLTRVYNADTSGTGTSVFRITNSGNNDQGSRIEFTDQLYYHSSISGDRTNGIQFGTNATGNTGVAEERMRIDPSGNVGIGTNNPTGAKLHVAGGIKGTDLIAHDATGINLQTDEGTKRLIVKDGGQTIVGIKGITVTSSGTSSVNDSGDNSLLSVQNPAGTAMNLQRWGVSNSGGSQDSYRFRIDQSFRFISNNGSNDTGEWDYEGFLTMGTTTQTTDTQITLSTNGSRTHLLDGYGGSVSFNTGQAASGNITDQTGSFSITNNDLGGQKFTSRAGRYLQSNGTGWGTSDGREPALVISSDYSTTGDRGLAGIILHNENNTNDVYGPSLSWGCKSSSNDYNTSYAWITGKPTGNSQDPNWKSGILELYTAQPGAGGYVDDAPGIRINDSGLVQKPKGWEAGSYFWAGGTSNPSGLSGNNGVVFISLEQGSSTYFSTSNGRYTCPVNGVYTFSAQVRIDSASTSSSYFRMAFYTGTTATFQNSYKQGHVIHGPGMYSQNYFSMNSTWTVYLTAGTEVGVVVTMNSGTYTIHSESNFSGHLVG